AYTVAVDSIDGTLARALEVKRVLPIVDGTRLDDIVDYFTYVIVPALFLLHADLLPAGAAVPVALCPVLASAVGFSRIDAKTPDHFFTGFPSYWNIVAFYLWGLGWPRLANAAVVVAFSIAVFVPIRYVYPSRTRSRSPPPSSPLTWRACSVTRRRSARSRARRAHGSISRRPGKACPWTSPPPRRRRSTRSSRAPAA